MKNNIGHLFTKAALLCTVCGAALLASCSKSDTDETGTDIPASEQAVGFTANDIHSRGSVVTNTELTSMGVFGSYTGTSSWNGTTAPNYFYNQAVAKSGAVWSYSPVKYWPVAPNKISFFAYAPHSTDAAVAGKMTLSTAAATGAPTLTYTVESTPADQVDLLYAVLKDQQKQSTPLNFAFGHAMAKVSFSALLKSGEEAKDYTATITEVKITDVKNKGTLNLETGAWTTTADKGSYTLTPTTGLKADASNLVFETSETTDFSARTLTADNGYLFLMPQTLASGAKLTVKYTLTSGSFTETVVKDIDLSTLLINGAAAWGKGKSVEYRLTIEGKFMTASVIDWSDGEQGATVIDGVNFLKVSDKDFMLSKWEKPDTRIKVTTNIDEWSAKVIAGGTWLTLNGADGNGEVTGATGEDVSFAVTQYPSATGQRDGKIRIVAGTLTFDVFVSQNYEDQEFMLRLSQSELIFPARKYIDPANSEDYTVPDPQEINVSYGPTNRNYDMAMTLYSGEGIKGFTPAATSNAATIVVDPSSILHDSPLLEDDPFYERGSILRFTAYDQAGTSTISKQVVIRQINYAAVVAITQDYYFQGASYSIVIKSNTPWRAVFESDGNTFENISGDSQTSTAHKSMTLKFKIKDNAAVDQTAILRVESPEGKFPTQRYRIHIQDALPNAYFLTPGSATPLEIPVRKAYRVWRYDRNLYADDGRTLDDLAGACTAELVWQDVAGLISDVAYVGSGADAKIKVTAGTGTGNAVVALKIGGEIYWSWHVWVTDETAIPVIPTGSKNLMDRHLGAINNIPGDVGFMGLYYQYGRKDPFPAPKYFGYGTIKDLYPLTGSTPLVDGYKSLPAFATPSIDKAIHNPNIHYYGAYGTTNWYALLEDARAGLWDYTIKTDYDPCPEGWRVMTYDALSSFPAGLTSVSKNLNYGGHDWPRQGYHNATGASNAAYSCGTVFVVWTIASNNAYTSIGYEYAKPWGSGRASTGANVRCMQE